MTFLQLNHSLCVMRVVAQTLVCGGRSRELKFGPLIPLITA
jgi:hypothetical protein